MLDIELGEVGVRSDSVQRKGKGQQGLVRHCLSWRVLSLVTALRAHIAAALVPLIVIFVVRVESLCCHGEQEQSSSLEVVINLRTSSA